VKIFYVKVFFDDQDVLYSYIERMVHYVI